MTCVRWNKYTDRQVIRVHICHVSSVLDQQVILILVKLPPPADRHAPSDPDEYMASYDAGMLPRVDTFSSDLVETARNAALYVTLFLEQFPELREVRVLPMGPSAVIGADLQRRKLVTGP
jgi:hypothetical protein